MVSTNALAEELETKAPSVTDMVRKLKDKKLITYKKYKGVQLTNEGALVAIKVIRKHRLWEVFLVDKLQFAWDEVHEVAEQLEHIVSPKLVDRLESFLEFPKFDPHGDPIPSKDGVFPSKNTHKLSHCKKGNSGFVRGVENDETSFLQYLTHIGLRLNDHIKLEKVFDFDGSMEISINKGKPVHISQEVAENILIESL